MQVEPFAILLLSILLGAVGQIGLKKGMAARPDFRLRQLPSLINNVPIWTGFLSYGVSILLYFKALQSIALSVAYPTVSLGYVVVVILSRIAFKEEVTMARWLAVSIICLGVAFVGLGSNQ